MVSGGQLHAHTAVTAVSPQNGKSVDEVERAVLEEFGRCMKQIISSAQSGIVSYMSYM